MIDTAQLRRLMDQIAPGLVIDDYTMRVAQAIYAAGAEEAGGLRAELERLRKGEFICQRCGLRKNDEHGKGDF